MNEHELTALVWMAFLFVCLMAIVIVQAWIEHTPAAAHKVDGWLDRFFGVEAPE